MALPAPLDLADVLLKRYECLHTLGNHPQAKPELVSSLDIPRSTLDDIFRDLERADLVEYHNGKWQLTLLGRYTLDHHTRYKDGLESLTDAAAIVEELPQETAVKRRFLIDADVHVATGPVPDEVMQVFLNAVESASHVRSVTPLAMASYADSFYRRATAGSDSQLEVVLPLETFERLRVLHPDQTDKAMADENTTLYHGNVPVTFSLWIGDDDHAGLIVYADQGVQGILVNDTDDALAWANEQYDHIQENAKPIFYRGSAKRTPGYS